MKLTTFTEPNGVSKLVVIRIDKKEAAGAIIELATLLSGISLPYNTPPLCSDDGNTLYRFSFKAPDDDE